MMGSFLSNTFEQCQPEGDGGTQRSRQDSGWRGHKRNLPPDDEEKGRSVLVSA